MALIKCPECGKEISDTAKQCPNCGHPLTQKKLFTMEKKSCSTHIKLKKKEIAVLIIAAATLLISVICLFSISSNNHGMEIRTADQWVTYCDHEPNIHRCLNAFDKIDLTTQRRIFGDLAQMVAHITYQDEKERIKKDAYGYLLIYMVAYEKGKELYKSGLEMGDTRYADMLGADRIDELAEQWKRE